ncbi:hypothetical protein RHMOL_Rhmol05G0049700 [Rhododendron molle]|uniref:Uncharacterized protein n=1 Tax=Rhododendron molle TaxID=49168 RepID=A0ACC0NMP4_RHOML|nr:hypothetical protein RHMOL_Rhmol05G0049700 [Rhododendron molle]
MMTMYPNQKRGCGRETDPNSKTATEKEKSPARTRICSAVTERGSLTEVVRKSIRTNNGKEPAVQIHAERGVSSLVMVVVEEEEGEVDKCWDNKAQIKKVTEICDGDESGTTLFLDENLALEDENRRLLELETGAPLGVSSAMDKFCEMVLGDIIRFKSMLIVVVKFNLMAGLFLTDGWPLTNIFARCVFELLPRKLGWKWSVFEVESAVAPSSSGAAVVDEFGSVIGVVVAGIENLVSDAGDTLYILSQLNIALNS